MILSKGNKVTQPQGATETQCTMVEQYHLMPRNETCPCAVGRYRSTIHNERAMTYGNQKRTNLLCRPVACARL